MPAQAPRSPRLSSLLDQQLWFIGHDIRHADGNALVRFGFERRRSSHGGTSCYQLRLDNAPLDIVCWGFGIYVGPLQGQDGSPAPGALPGLPPARPQGVLVQRHVATPRLLAHPLELPVHQPADLPPLRSPGSARDWDEIDAGLQLLAAVFSRYEAWACETLGVAHRTQVLSMVPRHKRRRFCQATDLAPWWNARAVSGVHTTLPGG
jgi:hypothetical protein